MAGDTSRGATTPSNIITNKRTGSQMIVNSSRSSSRGEGGEARASAGMVHGVRVASPCRAAAGAGKVTKAAAVAEAVAVAVAEAMAKTRMEFEKGRRRRVAGGTECMHPPRRLP